MDIVDLTDKAPPEYRVRTRKPEEITSITIHATGFTRAPNNPRWALVAAHYVVRQDGSILLLHDPLVRMRVGSGLRNATTISIEHELNPVNEHGRAFMPEEFGVSALTPEQVTASRELIASLCATYPSIKYMSAHRHIGPGKTNCPGPQTFSEIGMWAIGTLGLTEASVMPKGKPLPASWKRPPTMCM